MSGTLNEAGTIGRLVSWPHWSEKCNFAPKAETGSKTSCDALRNRSFQNGGYARPLSFVYLLRVHECEVNDVFPAESKLTGFDKHRLFGRLAESYLGNLVMFLWTFITWA